MEIRCLLVHHRYIFATEVCRTSPAVVGVKEHINIQTDELVSVPPSSPTKVLDGAGKMSVEKAGCGPLQQSEVTDMKSADLHDNLTAIGLLAAEALRGCGWNGVDRDSIQVEDLSGAGGSKTYKITVTGGGKMGVLGTIQTVVMT